MTVINRLLNTARDEIGYLEKKSNAQLDSKTANAGYNNWTKYARDLDLINFYNGKKNGYEWCDIFCDWCFVRTFGKDTALKMTGQKLGGLGAGCTFSAQYYAKIGKFHKFDPKPGDQIFFTRNGGKDSCHTGLVERVDREYVYTIEGNTSGASGVVSNGGGVCRKSYPLGSPYIYGYGRPDYDLVEAATLKEEDEMEVARFKELWSEMRKELQDNDSGDWSKAAREWATSVGLITGTGKLANGEKNYAWADVLTREQAAVMLYRFAQMIIVQKDNKFNI